MKFPFFEINSNSIKQILAITILLPLFDFAYLYVNRVQFQKLIESVQKRSLQLRLFPTAICYALMIFGIYYFIVRSHESILHAFLLGAYVIGVYDLTNYSTFIDWNWLVVIQDTIWGGVLFSLVTFLTYQL